MSRQRTVFVIEDETHAEPQPGNYATFDAALEELRRLSRLPWNEAPNRAPCTSWRTCGRIYEIIQYSVSDDSWEEVQRRAVLEVSAGGAKWLSDFDV